MSDDDRDNHMSLSGGEDANSDDNERNSGDEAEEDNKGEGAGRRVDPKTSTVKRIVRNPQPKLNPQRLKGPKGIQTIEKYFEGFKFHGKGHEKQDLDRIMKRLEHWGHRLFPKYQFDDFLEKVEVIGTKKKEMLSFLSKYRQDMDLGDGSGTVGADEDDGIQRGNSPEPVDEFDLLIAEQIERNKQAQAVRQHNDEIFDNLLSSRDQQSNQINTNTQITTVESPRNVINLPNVSSAPSYTLNSSNLPAVTLKQTTSVEESEEEIKKRIERNRQIAIERRLARLKQNVENKRKTEVKPQDMIKPVELSVLISDDVEKTFASDFQVEPTSSSKKEAPVINSNELKNSIITDIDNLPSQKTGPDTIEKVGPREIEKMDTDGYDLMAIDLPSNSINNDIPLVTIDGDATNNMKDKSVSISKTLDTSNQNSSVNHNQKVRAKPRILADEELDDEITAAVRKFLMQKRQLQ